MSEASATSDLSTAALAAARPEVPIPSTADQRLTPAQWGIIAFLGSEVAFFSTLIVAYLSFFGRDHQPGGLGGPTPLEVLSLPLALLTTCFLLSSSGTIHMAEKSIAKGTGFNLWWGATIVLGLLFLFGTAHEWRDLIHHEGLTISRNLFGTTFYTLVGFHALHVTIGVLVMVLILSLALRQRLGAKQHTAVQLVSWYWHFVDAVWIVVLLVVYVLPHVA